MMIAGRNLRTNRMVNVAFDETQIKSNMTVDEILGALGDYQEAIIQFNSASRFDELTYYFQNDDWLRIFDKLLVAPNNIFRLTFYDTNAFDLVYARRSNMCDMQLLMERILTDYQLAWNVVYKHRYEEHYIEMFPELTDVIAQPSIERTIQKMRELQVSREQRYEESYIPISASPRP